MSDAKMVLFSDDIANVVDNPITLQRVYTLLSEALAWFNMRFDTTKFQFIRFGTCHIEEINLVDLDGSTHSLR
jgi:hypothetical protein